MADTDASAPTTQEPEIGSEEWVERTLKAKGIQADAEESQAAESQDEASQATEATGEIVAATSATPSWRQAVIPSDDETVPEHFRGKQTGDVWNSYRELERQFNEDRKHTRKIEAELAATKTIKEFVEAQQAAVAKPQNPADEYSSLGIDLDTAPILNPREFYPKHDALLLDKVKTLINEEKAKADAEKAKADAEAAQVQRVADAIEFVRKSRGFSVDQMKERLPSIMMTTAQRLGPAAVESGEQLLATHDAIFGAPAPVTIPAQQEVPNPPGVKRPAVVESVRSNAPQLKQYERETLVQVAEDMSSNLGIKIDPDKLMAGYAVNLKRARG